MKGLVLDALEEVLDSWESEQGAEQQIALVQVPDSHRCVLSRARCRHAPGTQGTIQKTG